MSTATSADGHRSGRISRFPADDTLPRWRAWVVTHPVASSLLAGGVATQFATVFGIWFKGFGLPTLNWPTVNGVLIIPTASPGAQYFAGWISHFADGVFFALLFALLFHPLIPLRNSILGNIIKAILYGTILAIISAAWFVPYVAYPHSGAGIFSSGFGWKIVFGIFLWHWIYGYFLGSVYCPLPRQRAVPEPRSAPITETPSAETTPVL
jgi:hypothetical protein